MILELLEAIAVILLLIFAVIHMLKLSEDASIENNVYHGIWTIIIILILS